MKLHFILTLFIVLTVTNASECWYPYSFRFNDSKLSPLSANIIKKDKNILTNLLLTDSRDNYISVTNYLSFTFYKDKNSTLKKINNSKNIKGYLFNAKIKKQDITISIYKNNLNKIEEYLLFIFYKKSLFLGSIFAYSQTSIDNILKTIEYYNKNTCTENYYWKIYKSIDEKKVNSRLRILYSIYLINPSKKVNREILKTLKLKKLITIDLPISYLDKNITDNNKTSK